MERADDGELQFLRPAHAVPLASARQRPENQKENRAGHSPERAVDAGGTIAFATTAQPAARFGGLTNTITRVNAIEGALAEMARAQARTAESLVQLTTSVTALVQHAGIASTLPAPPPAPVPRTFAAIAAAPAPATAASAPPGFPELPTAGTSSAEGSAVPWHGAMTQAGGSGPMHTGAAPSAEMDLNDGSVPVNDAPVSRRTRLWLALASDQPWPLGPRAGNPERAGHPPDPSPRAPTSGRPGFPFGFLGAGGRLPKA